LTSRNPGAARTGVEAAPGSVVVIVPCNSGVTETLGRLSWPETMDPGVARSGVRTTPGFMSYIAGTAALVTAVFVIQVTR
jgi:hypothetical protein